MQLVCCGRCCCALHNWPLSLCLSRVHIVHICWDLEVVGENTKNLCENFPRLKNWHYEGNIQIAIFLF